MIRYSIRKDSPTSCALIPAIENGDLEAVKSYIDQGGNVDIQLTDTAQMPLLSIAAAENQVHIVRYLLRCGATIDSRDMHGRTALSWAAERGALDIIELLVENGAEVNVEDTEWRTPQMWAARAQAGEDVEEYLRSHGARTDLGHNSYARALFSVISRLESARWQPIYHLLRFIWGKLQPTMAYTKAARGKAH